MLPCMWTAQARTKCVVLYVLGSVLFVNITLLKIIILHAIIFLLLLHIIIFTIIIFLHHLLNVQCLREVSHASFDFIFSIRTHVFLFARPALCHIFSHETFVFTSSADTFAGKSHMKGAFSHPQLSMC